MMRSTQTMRFAARQTLRSRPIRSTRAFATAPPPPAGQPAPDPTKNAKKGDSTTLYLLLGGTVAGIGAWYMMQEQPQRVEQEGAHAIDKAFQKTEGYAKTIEAVGKDKYNELKAAGENQLADARVRARAEDAHARDYIGEGQNKAGQSYADAKGYAAQQAAAAQDAITDTRDTAAQKYGQLKGAAGEKYESAKGTVASKYDGAKQEVRSQYAHARTETELKYDDAKARAAALERDAESKYNEAKGAAQDTAKDAKKGWFSWLGWGKAKAEDAQQSAIREKDAAKHSLTGAIADKAEATREWAEGKKGETIQEKEGNVKRADRYTSSL